MQRTTCNLWRRKLPRNLLAQLYSVSTTATAKGGLPTTTVLSQAFSVFLVYLVNSYTSKFAATSDVNNFTRRKLLLLPYISHTESPHEAETRAFKNSRIWQSQGKGAAVYLPSGKSLSTCTLSHVCTRFAFRLARQWSNVIFHVILPIALKGWALSFQLILPDRVASNLPWLQILLKASQTTDQVITRPPKSPSLTFNVQYLYSRFSISEQHLYSVPADKYTWNPLNHYCCVKGFWNQSHTDLDNGFWTMIANCDEFKYQIYMYGRNWHREVNSKILSGGY